MTEQTTIAPRITEEMRDVLVEMGFDAARYAPAEKVHAKIENKFRGGIAGYMEYYGH